MTERIEKLETALAYLQDEVNQLNAIVTDQQMLVAKLEKQNEALNKRLEDMEAEDRPSRKPPHY